MATKTALRLHEHNDETVVVHITPVTAGDSLAGVTGIQFVLKVDPCRSDDDVTTLLLSSTVPGEVTITAQDADHVDAQVHIPAAALDGAYDRFYRVDALTGPLRRTALFGPVTVEDL